MSSARGLALVISLLLLVPATAPAVTADATTVADAEFRGDGVARTEGNVTYLWHSDNHTFSVNVTGRANTTIEQCLYTTPPNGSPQRVTCWPLSDTGRKNVSFQGWPAPTGPQNVTLRTRYFNDEENTTTHLTMLVHVLRRDADPDGDGLVNEREVAEGTPFFSSDADEDGLSDGAEVDTHGTDPLSADTDSDGLRDNAEVTGGTNATDPDTDGDGLEDGPEVNEYGTDAVSDPDTDGDGLEDGPEVHRYGTDPASADTDGDFLNDGTEVRLGLLPTSPWDVLFGVGALGLLVAFGGAYAVLRATRTRDPEDQTTPSAPDQSAEAPVGDGAGADIVTDEDRVLRMVREYDGAMPQKHITEETEWSASKVSRLLSRMEEEGSITKITLGRENIIRLGGEESLGDSSQE